MQVPFIDLRVSHTSIKKQLEEAMTEVIDKAHFIGGEPVDQFEKKFASFMEINKCVSCGNGTDALEIALKALGISAGDEVLVPAYTWVATAGAVIRAGAKPVFVDVDPETYCIDPEKVTSHINKNTKAIIPVHLYGHPAAMVELLEIAKKYQLKVLEDCAQAHNASIDGKKVGTFGDIATFSFFPTKNLGAMGDGGAIITNNHDLARQCFLIRNQGQEKKNVHITHGRNSRLDTLQAAILNVKLQHLEEWTQKREEVASWYDKYLNGANVVKPHVKNGVRHVFHLYVILAEKRDALKSYLEEQGVSTLIHYPKPLTSLTIYPPQDQKNYNIVNDLSEKILSLPMYPGLKEEQVQYICRQINQFFEAS